MKHISNLVLVRNGRILLGLRTPEREAYPNCWALPGGHVERDETPEQAACREIGEELGVTATVLIEVDSIKVPNQAEAVTYHIFVVVSWEGGEPRNLGGEHSELRWCLCPRLWCTS